MNWREHIPSWVDTDNRLTGDVQTVAELLALPCISIWKKNSDFDRFSHSKMDGYTILMVELSNNTRWWVIAYVSGQGHELLWDALPEWNHPES